MALPANGRKRFGEDLILALYAGGRPRARTERTVRIVFERIAEPRIAFHR